MSFHTIGMYECRCDLCGKAGAPAHTQQKAESLATGHGITRAPKGERHICDQCRLEVGAKPVVTGSAA